jgi:lipoate-protein ligase A
MPSRLTEQMGGWADGRIARAPDYPPIRLSAYPTWELLLEPHGRPGAENMAVDVELLQRADATGDAFLRLYRFGPPCLSFGRNEGTTGYDRAAIERLGLDVIRRPTGGGAVWHEHELTYAVAAPISMFGGLRAAYRAIHERVATALRSLGTDATLAPDRLTARPPDRRRSCFAAPVGGEVLVAGRKLVGSAQVRRRGAFLQHGSILLGGSQEMVGVISRQSSVISRETTLFRVLGRSVDFQEVADAIVAAWDGAVTSTDLPQPPPSSRTCFSSPAWTWRR